ncbi:hypothetical protein FX016_00010 [Cupriavidus gilardii]|nr:hypothetical protein FX016_00010 [Cupriavidus gilardii]
MVKLTWALLWRSIVVLAPTGMAVSKLMEISGPRAYGVDFVLMRPSFTFLAFAALFVLADSLLKANPLQLAFGWRLQLSTEEWRQLSFGMCGLMALIALLNAVMTHVSVAIWVDFKLIGIPFVLTCGLAYLARRIVRWRFQAAVSRQLDARLPKRR